MSNIQPLPFSRPAMLNYIDAVDEPFDIAVIGGGATGLYVALDAASRGYSTVLFERGDFAGGTSSKSTKLIHGGVRYMQQGRIGLVRESLRERHLLMHNAPHLVHALPILVPAYSRWQRLKYTAGVKGYGAVARGYGIGNTRRVNSEAAIEIVPGIRQDSLRGGAVYLDGQTDDARLGLTIAKTAAAHGAALVNYASVRALETSNGRISGVEAEDLLTGESIRVAARVVVNATGVFADDTMMLGPDGGSGLMRWSRGTHIVMEGGLLEGGHGLLVPETSDGRVIFALPWLGTTLVGTTDIAVDSPDAAQVPPTEDIDFLLEEIANYLPDAANVRVLSAFTGIRPLVSKDATSPTSQLARSHRILVSDAGLVSITGGKWTTSRLMAEQTVAKATEVAGFGPSQCATHMLRLEGFDQDAQDITRNAVTDPDLLYGTQLAAIKELEKKQPELAEPIAPGLPYRLSHAIYGVKSEMAQTLEDVLARRTRALFLDAEAALSAAKTVAQAIEQHCGLGAGWAQREMSKLPVAASAYCQPA